MAVFDCPRIRAGVDVSNGRKTRLMCKDFDRSRRLVQRRLAVFGGLLAAMGVSLVAQGRPQTPSTPAAPGAPAPEHRRLFAPQDLSLLESPDRAAWQRPDQIMDALQVADGSVVADIGAGAGWFTIQLARRVGPRGLVYSEDVQRQMLEAVKRRVTREGLQNVETRLGTPIDPHLPTGRLDAVLVVD